jgi:predicted RNA binding protein YcfA (HicA-like mRNA interferase family)
MPPRKKFSGAAVCRLLEQHGFAAVRQKGSHCVMQKKSLNGTITVPIPMTKT